MQKIYPSILESIQLIFIMLLIFSFSYVFIIILESCLNISLESNPYINTIIVFLSEIFTIFYAYKKNKALSNDKLEFFKPLSLMLFLTIIIFEIGVDIISSEISNIIQISFNIPSSNYVKDTINILYAVFVAPIFEEILFRGFILKGFLKNYNKFTAIIVSSLLFALLHLNLSTIIITFISGIFFSYLYIKTKSIIPCIFAHFLSNGLHNMLTHLFNIRIIGYNLNTYLPKHQPLWFNVLGIIFIIIGFFAFSKIITIDNY